MAQYHSSADTFDPQRWDAKALARLARESGARYRAVTLLGSGTPLAHQTNIEVHQEEHRGEDALGELLIAAPQPTGALVDVIAIDLGGEG